MSLLVAGNDEARAVLTALGWQLVDVADAAPVWRKAKERRAHRSKPEKPLPKHSPFASLKELMVK